MNGNLGILISCVSVFYVVIVESEQVQVIKPQIEKYNDDVKQVKFFGNSQNSNDNEARQVDSMVYKTVNKYYCSLDSILEVRGYGDVERRMLPLILSWAVTVHKLQGTTLETAVIDLGSHLMVYGSNGWTFPVQDVNLTLRYPPENRPVQPFEFIFNGENMTADDENYIITGFKVILYIDGPSSEGFINNGGVLQESISLSFVSSQLTYLSYEFSVYGARKDTPGVAELNSHYRLC